MQFVVSMHKRFYKLLYFTAKLERIFTALNEQHQNK